MSCLFFKCGGRVQSLKIWERPFSSPNACCASVKNTHHPLKQPGLMTRGAFPLTTDDEPDPEACTGGRNDSAKKVRQYLLSHMLHFLNELLVLIY